MSDMAGGWDHDLGVVLSGRALQEQPRYNGADGISDIEGKATRGGGSECGQRASFNGATGVSDVVKAASAAEQRRDNFLSQSTLNNRLFPKPLLIGKSLR